MSHFTVMVVGENVEDQLAKFCEDTEYVEEEFLEFEDKTEELEMEWNDGFSEGIMHEGEFIHKHNISSKLKIDEEEVEKMEKIKLYHRDRYSSIEEFAEKYFGYQQDPETGEYGYWTNPYSKWDWYQVGGRWRGFFKLKEENGSAPEHLLGEPGVFNNEPRYQADVAFKKDVDWEGMMANEKEIALQTYDLLEKITKGIAPPPKAWHEFMQDYDDIDKAREDYNNHPWIKTVKGAEGMSFWMSDPVASLMIFDGGREAYVEKRGKEAITTFAFLRNGQWYENGRMGWWGVVTGEECDWTDQFHLLLEDVPEDELLTIVDCHI